MTGKDDEPKPAPKAPDRTVFVAGGGVDTASAPPAKTADEDAGRESTAAEEDWFSGQSAEAEPVAAAGPPKVEPAPSSWDDTPASPPPPSAPPSSAAPVPDPTIWSPPPRAPAPSDVGQAPAPPPKQGQIAIGMVLNHIYEVRRFLARGGMGEVYEGVNVTTDERVAIKVILPHLARDENVLKLFRKEAGTLIKLGHPALVKYRVMALDPVLGVYFIVTEFIDGVQLDARIGQIRPNAEELEALMRRLAAGLEAAHALGAIHRDLSPDNVILPDGRLDQATIIDFGIAKDVDPSKGTVIGDGFAGKLGFVAPEQLGAFDRSVGPWTDVYSLGLVILAVAAGKPIDMGSTMVDAVDKRRAPIDLTSVPERLRPVLAAMLKPDPAERLRSMTEVLQALDRADGVSKPKPEPRARQAPPVTAKAPASGPPMPALIAGGVALVVIVGALAFFGLSRSGHQGAGSQQASATPAVRGSEQVRRAVEAALPGVACTWLDVDDVSDVAGGVSLRLSGVAGSPTDAQKAISAAAHSAGAPISGIDASNVFPVSANYCAALDAFRSRREVSSGQSRRLVSAQAEYRLVKDNSPPCDGHGANATKLVNAGAVVNINIGDPSKDFSLIGIDQDGKLAQLVSSRAQFTEQWLAKLSQYASQLSGDRFTLTSCYNEPAVIGELLLTGPGPIHTDLPSILQTDTSKAVDAAWLQKFTSDATANNWRTSMVWYRVVRDEASN